MRKVKKFRLINSQRWQKQTIVKYHQRKRFRVSTMEAVVYRIVFLVSFVIVCVTGSEVAGSDVKPNVILFVADDLGYGDLASYGHPVQEYGAVDELARTGMRFTNAYVPDSMDSPSRGALLTGRLPVRVGLYGTDARLFTPTHTTGLPKDELTLPEALKDLGYVTGMVGKWHLGINENTSDDGAHLPQHHGFDYVGTNLPWTNQFECDEDKRLVNAPSSESCFLYVGDRIISQPFRHDELTSSFVSDAKGFISDNPESPFFLYFAFAHNHPSLFTGPDSVGSSRRGLLGDGTNEMSWALSEIQNHLVSLGMENDTIILFISDNGPHLELCAEAGITGTIRGGKSTSWEGGIRVPFLAHWPGRIQPSTLSRHLVSSMDIYPTVVELAGGEIPANLTLDGSSLVDILLEGGTKANMTTIEPQSTIPDPHQSLFFYCRDKIMAVRDGDIKYHFYTQPIKPLYDYAEGCGEAGVPQEDMYACALCDDECLTIHDPPIAYNVAADPNEAYPLNLTDDAIAYVSDLVSNHVASVTPGNPLLTLTQNTNEEIAPCCDPPACTCNYVRPTEASPTPTSQKAPPSYDLRAGALLGILAATAFFVRAVASERGNGRIGRIFF